MDDEIIRILVSTDNHLGYMEKDPVRGDDSFATFEEVLCTAKEKKADLVLFAGDMFHENKPSRHTMHSAIQLCRKYCLGDQPVFTEILNEEKDIFKAVGGQVNFENPYQSVCLPIYAIHGNHDDPSRDCIRYTESLSALDILAASNLINYFGKSDRVEDIEIKPILIRKGRTHIAIYGLGAIRDERLNRMWSNKNVKFIRPSTSASTLSTSNSDKDIDDSSQQEANPSSSSSTSTESIKYFNIFLIHQNRDYGRGTKNCIHESMIPEWMDLVIWGNEHECIPHLVESLVGTYRIYQPGSSVITSLCDGESMSHPKSMGLIEIRHTREFRFTSILYKQLRLFKYAEISLADIKYNLNINDPKIEEKIKKLLIKQLHILIQETRDEGKENITYNEQLYLENSTNNSSSSSTSSSTNDINHIDLISKKRLFLLKNPKQVLIRLRVDHGGYPTIHAPRLGTYFTSEVANASDLITFKRTTTTRNTDGNGTSNTMNVHDQLQKIIKEGGTEDEIYKIKIEDLVTDSLNSKNKQLNLLPENEMAKALDDYIIKREIHAISETVTEALKHIQKELIVDLTNEKLQLDDLGIVNKNDTSTTLETTGTKSTTSGSSKSSSSSAKNAANNTMNTSQQLATLAMNKSKLIITEAAMKIKIKTDEESKKGLRLFPTKNKTIEKYNHDDDDFNNIDNNDDVVDGTITTTTGRSSTKKTTTTATSGRGGSGRGRGGRSSAAESTTTGRGRGRGGRGSQNKGGPTLESFLVSSQQTSNSSRNTHAESDDEEEFNAAGRNTRVLPDDDSILNDNDDDDNAHRVMTKNKGRPKRAAAAATKVTSKKNKYIDNNSDEDEDDDVMILEDSVDEGDDHEDEIEEDDIISIHSDDDDDDDENGKIIKSRKRKPTTSTTAASSKATKSTTKRSYAKVSDDVDETPKSKRTKKETTSSSSSNKTAIPGSGWQSKVSSQFISQQTTSGTSNTMGVQETPMNSMKSFLTMPSYLNKGKSSTSNTQNVQLSSSTVISQKDKTNGDKRSTYLTGWD